MAHCGCNKVDALGGRLEQPPMGRREQKRNRSRSPSPEEGECKDNARADFRERSPLRDPAREAELETFRQDWRAEVSGRGSGQSSLRSTDQNDGRRGRNVLTSPSRTTRDTYPRAPIDSYRPDRQQPAPKREERPFNPPPGPRAKGNDSFKLPYRVSDERKADASKVDERKVDEGKVDERGNGM
jgi:hypothetical protein